MRQTSQIENIITKAEQLPANTFSNEQIISLIDHTRLKEQDNPEAVKEFCHFPIEKKSPIAAICLYPEYLTTCKTMLKDAGIKSVAVCNFPSGNDPLDEVMQQLAKTIQAGADEIDLVMPYQAYLAGEQKQALKLVRQCRDSCNDMTLKIILEVGAFHNNYQTLYQLSRELIDCGVDFLKTSTGKISHNVTPATATTLLLAIEQAKSHIGFKISGGIQNKNHAINTLNLAKIALGNEFHLHPDHIRIGSSKLLSNLLNQ